MHQSPQQKQVQDSNLKRTRVWRSLQQGWRHWVPEGGRVVMWTPDEELESGLVQLGYDVVAAGETGEGPLNGVLFRDLAPLAILALPGIDALLSRLRPDGVLIQICQQGGKGCAGQSIVSGFKAGWSLKARYEGAEADRGVTLVWKP
ncbi:hypothetical protein FCL40_04135 [Ferrimonas sediminicola]|uniref:Uncharacterized protein n=1 Tax=Ferrimonas sediminicola TaxID=2569538 RepID=A0A4U1BGN2_9GAMM|nr:hypothetical protein [Ferrimonas sediminicola]TKB50351.1 hypothetical protein FCL40_04135 [Ferrimonas sediminicola]